MSTVSFLNIGMHGYINPTLPVVAELVRRGHTVTYHTSPAFAVQIEAAGAKVHLYSGGDLPLPDPPIPLAMLEELARTALGLLPGVLSDLRSTRPDLIVHGAACPWGAVAARELGVPAAATFTTFAFNRQVPSPTGISRELVAAAAARPRLGWGFVRARWALHRGYDTRALPLTDLMNAREPLNLVFTSSAFQPGAAGFDSSYRFVGASVGSRLTDPGFDAIRLEDPVLYASLGTVFDAGPALLRTFATALAPLGGTVVVSTGHTEPADLGPLPANVLVRPSVPQLQVLDRAALFVTHGGMNSVNEAMWAGVPTLVVPQGADQPLVARRVVELGAGLALRTEDATAETVHALARSLLNEPRFREAAAAQRAAQQKAGGARRAADELEQYLDDARGGTATDRARGR
ncbi:macrolide family glycosyltransferase [Sinorhizobium fredii]|uniref:Oleandomycin glycosyltransferase n=2 Tax=Rhizobium fredii TaxID=380 RepID=A0A2A6LP67_RHIFR|nr:macrolide family glycosyltransferase [Sinorhizobium fredii]KSV81109.1 oleandomycin glycosyltransferase [Sinorhizobium fredii USDA 205]MQW94365.1 oleandomycin glycosyltransferase [Sinorhizobium fredii]MQX11406.1 oleandomycin glycosyltransferase [Sinorhizobium fredii]PDT44022.1 oleandomycin glycosyltransferase [Sinorhizobium fredii]UTY51113.1 oleandomycin glycosyltransferase [Sinorhizobium fredii]